MKSVWKGSMSFGLVNIPVRMYSAIEPKTFGFRLLHEECGTPIKYKRWCPHCGKDVAWNQITKGIELRKGHYLAISNDELKKMKPPKSDIIEIISFTDSYQIGSIYVNKHYYLSPEKAKDKAYFLFKEVLQSTAKVALGRFVMREKEHICAIGGYKSGLLLTTMNYSYEVRDINQLEELKTAPKLSEQELELAKQLIDKLYEESFDISQFKDTFADKLKEMIEKPGRKAIPERKVERKNLLEALRASIREK